MPTSRPPRPRRRRACAATSPTASPRSRRARLKGTKTCRYEITPDSHFIAAEHDGVWIVGGGSGHGFKHGPAMAERIIAAWHGGAPLPHHFGLHTRERAPSLRTAGSN